MVFAVSYGGSMSSGEPRARSRTGSCRTCFCGFSRCGSRRSRRGRIIVGVSVAVALWAIVEYLFDLHVFETMPPVGLDNLRAIWQSIQIRNGDARSEAAFGTSIVLATFLAIAVPFALRSRTRLALIGAPIVLSLGILRRSRALASSLSPSLVPSR